MAEIINLKQARKRKKRANDEKQAESNRLQFGRTKAERKLTEAQHEQARQKLDAHKRDDASRD